jgi:hypothetical protein
MYDEAAVSAWFREEAARADREFRAARGRAEADAILARSCVFGYLYDRYFLENLELLVNELQWLRKGGKPRAPRHALSVATFNAERDALLDALIRRFQQEWLRD